MKQLQNSSREKYLPSCQWEHVWEHSRNGLGGPRNLAYKRTTELDHREIILFSYSSVMMKTKQHQSICIWEKFDN